MEEDEKAIMMLVVIVGFGVIWVVLEELNYLGLPII
ncbi:membrane protein [Vibrio parahaemolyticus]|nr:membrane protein [Vibrio parahaemolyticus]